MLGVFICHSTNESHQAIVPGRRPESRRMHYPTQLVGGGASTMGISKALSSSCQPDSLARIDSQAVKSLPPGTKTAKWLRFGIISFPCVLAHLDGRSEQSEELVDRRRCGWQAPGHVVWIVTTLGACAGVWAIAGARQIIREPPKLPEHPLWTSSQL